MAKEISEKAEKRLAEIIEKYPEKRSAALPALYIVQEEHGMITEEGIKWVAERVGLSPVHVKELATFYTMFHEKPVGRYHIQVCRTLSCAICGCKGLSEYIVNRLGIKPGEVTEDGLWSFEEVECLGSCGTAPMVEINDTYFENLTPEKLGEIMDRIEKEKPDLSLSTINDKLGEGLKGHPRSEVYP
ncbi:MAG: NADH-quinone oxidoreductase subunit NuoE [Candidatus Dadabacteria bacterium]|nr:MAG: NADH-quinone oxidoreductase subunit NuoE [Candidatus Dadabacteria bacterium]